MKFVNTNSNEKAYKKVKRFRNFLAVIPLIIALVVSIVLKAAVFRDHDLFIFIICVGAMFLVCGIISIIIIIFAFSDKLRNTKATEEEDFSSNIAVCNKCGRYFAFSELEWRETVNNGETSYGESDTLTIYKHGISVKSECPQCKTQSRGYIETGSSSERTVLVNHIGSDRYSYKTYADSYKLSENEIEEEVKSKYRLDLISAQSKIEEYINRGYVIDQSDDIVPIRKSDFYNIFLFGVIENREAVANIIKEWTHCTETEAMRYAEKGGIVISRLSEVDADTVLEQLTSAGATAEKQEW